MTALLALLVGLPYNGMHCEHGAREHNQKGQHMHAHTQQ